jgi:hypothetical protein
VIDVSFEVLTVRLWEHAEHACEDAKLRLTSFHISVGIPFSPLFQNTSLLALSYEGLS